jgi:hypothetical protein
MDKERKRKGGVGRGGSGVPETTGWRKRAAAARWMEEAAAAIGRGKRRRAIDPDGGREEGFGEDDSTLYPASRFGSAQLVSVSFLERWGRTVTWAHRGGEFQLQHNSPLT